MMPLTNHKRDFYALIVMFFVSIMMGASCDLLAAEKTTPPVIPDDFDQPTVARLIETADKNNNDAVLKIGYFRNRRRSSFPVLDGYLLLKQNLQKEAEGSRKWFILKSIQGWAALRLRSGDGVVSDGLDVYSTLFDHYREANESGATDSLWRSIYEYVSTVPSPYLSRSNVSQSMVQNILQKALLASVRVKMKQESFFQPDWVMAVQSQMSDRESQSFLDDIKSTVKDKSVSSNYRALKSIADFFSVLYPKYALELVESSAILEGKTASQKDWQNNLLVNILENDNKADEAISMQQKYVEVTGRGRMRLIELYWKSSDAQNADKVISVIQPLFSSQADENEIINVGQFLMRSSTLIKPINGSAPRAVGEDILQNYLNSPRNRSQTAELMARLSLAQSLSVDGDNDKAALALSIDGFTPPVEGTHERRLYDLVLRKKALLAASNK